ncbi:MAG: MFS transporter [Candidatus Dormibacteraeota bacterium]|nr:MFS transporter [Candidatus Dormibacteraeota bacterium]
MAQEAPRVDRTGQPGGSRRERTAVWTLLGANALTGLGIGFFLPILPLFVASRGATSLLVGLVFAAGVVGRALVQYPAGWLSDRVGRRPVLVFGLLAYALLFPLYLLPVPPAALIAVRFVHALAGGSVSIAATALIADLTAVEGRGKAFGRLRASDMAGILLGPPVAGLVASVRLDAVFLGGAVVSLLALLLMLRLPSAQAPRTVEQQERPVSSWRLVRLLLPVAVLGAPIFWTFGTYDTVWSLYLTGRGASPFLVGLSFATYAAPVILLGGLAGGLADRLGAFRAATLALLTYGLLAGTYGFISSVPLLILVGLLEGALTAAGNPALMAEVSRRAPPGAQGRTQGAYSLMLLAGEVAGAVAGGALYLRGPAYAFLGATTVCLAGAACGLALRWRERAASSRAPVEPGY